MIDKFYCSPFYEVVVFDKACLLTYAKAGSTSLTNWDVLGYSKFSWNDIINDRSIIQGKDILVPWRFPINRMITGLFSAIMMLIRDELIVADVKNYYSAETLPYYTSRFYTIINEWAKTFDYTIYRMRWHTILLQDHFAEFDYKNFLWFPLSQYNHLHEHLNKTYDMGLPQIPKRNSQSKRTWGLEFWKYEQYLMTHDNVMNSIYQRAMQDYTPELLLDLR